MRVYHEDYGFGYMIQRCGLMGVAHINFDQAGQRIVPLEELEELV